ncbi:MAG: hypothetical protein PHH82_04610, partial [Candidatus ainarchaeum sp.]|nr:hypothetical protein [Candidatus ainarchaeum sp.]
MKEITMTDTAPKWNDVVEEFKKNKPVKDYTAPSWTKIEKEAKERIELQTKEISDDDVYGKYWKRLGLPETSVEQKKLGKANQLLEEGIDIPIISSWTQLSKHTDMKNAAELLKRYEYYKKTGQNENWKYFKTTMTGEGALHIGDDLLNLKIAEQEAIEQGEDPRYIKQIRNQIDAIEKTAVSIPEEAAFNMSDVVKARDMVMEAVAYNKYIENRGGYSTLSKIEKGVVDMLKFAVEMYASSGLLKAMGAENKALRAAIRTYTAGIGDTVLKKMDYESKDYGALSFVSASIDTFIDYYTEELGGALEKAAKPATQILTRYVDRLLENKFGKKASESLSKFTKEAAIEGFTGEYLEEVAASLMKYAAGTQEDLGTAEDWLITLGTVMATVGGAKALQVYNVKKEYEKEYENFIKDGFLEFKEENPEIVKEIKEKGILSRNDMKEYGLFDIVGITNEKQRQEIVNKLTKPEESVFQDKDLKIEEKPIETPTAKETEAKVETETEKEKVVPEIKEGSEINERNLRDKYKKLTIMQAIDKASELGIKTTNKYNNVLPKDVLISNIISKELKNEAIKVRAEKKQFNRELFEAQKEADEKKKIEAKEAEKQRIEDEKKRITFIKQKEQSKIKESAEFETVLSGYTKSIEKEEEGKLKEQYASLQKEKKEKEKQISELKKKTVLLEKERKEINEQRKAEGLPTIEEVKIKEEQRKFDIKWEQDKNNRMTELAKLSYKQLIEEATRKGITGIKGIKKDKIASRILNIEYGEIAKDIKRPGRIDIEEVVGLKQVPKKKSKIKIVKTSNENLFTQKDLET